MEEQEDPYDVVIIGAGIAGLTACHELLHQSVTPPPKRILLLEQSDRIGGRVRTQYVRGATSFHNGDPPTALELGAMRLSPEIHTFLLRVMQEELHFDLKTDLVPLVETKEYALRAPYDPQHAHLAQQLSRYDASVLETALVDLTGDHLFAFFKPFSHLLNSLLHHLPAQWLEKMSLSDALYHYASTGPSFQAFLRDALGYTFPFDMPLNAYEGLTTMDLFMPKGGFYTFRPGLRAFLERWMEYLGASGGVEIRLNQKVKELRILGDGTYELLVDQILRPPLDLDHPPIFYCAEEARPVPDNYPTLLTPTTLRARAVFFAVPQAALQQIHLPSLLSQSSRFQRMFESILPVPLMRVYVQFPYQWFPWDAQTFIISSGPIRQFFPVGDLNLGIFQVYMDDGAADYWDRAVHQGVDGFLERLSEDLQKLFPGYQVPHKGTIRLLGANYCAHAAHMFLPGVPVDQVVDQMVQPWAGEGASGGIGDRLFVCGEAWSMQHGFMSGATETAQRAVERYRRVVQ